MRRGDEKEKEEKVEEEREKEEKEGDKKEKEEMEGGEREIKEGVDLVTTTQGNFCIHSCLLLLPAIPFQPTSFHIYHLLNLLNIMVKFGLKYNFPSFIVSFLTQHLI